MVDNIILCITGTLGFCVLLNAPKSRIIYMIIGAALSASIYEVLSSILNQSIFISTLISTITIEAYSEILARIIKAPATIILLPSTIPLLPGGALYKAMINVTRGNANEAFKYASETAQISTAIAIGAVISLITINIIRYSKHHFTKK